MLPDIRPSDVFGGSSVGCAVSIGVGAGRRFGRSVSDKIGGAALRRDGVGLSVHRSFFGKIRFRSDLGLRRNGFGRSVLPHAAANSKIVVKRMEPAKESFFIISLISAHIFCACRVCVKCAQTQSSRLKNFLFQSLYLRFFIMCRKK